MESRHIAVAVNITQTDNMWFKYVLIATMVLDIAATVTRAIHDDDTGNAVFNTLATTVVNGLLIAGILHYWGA